MPKSKKGKPRERKLQKKGTSWFGFFFVLIVTSLTFFAGSLLYYKYNKKIPPLFPTKIKEKVTVNLYFGDPMGKSLIKEEREIEESADLSAQAEQVILELIGGPNTNLTRTIPPSTTLRDFYVDTNHIAYVDFTSELTRRHIGGSFAELLTVYSIVNSLTLNFEYIQKVQVLVEGERVETIAGHISTITPFETNKRIIGN